MTANPVIAEVTRHDRVESQHRGTFVVCDGVGTVIAALGSHETPVFPRSAVKALQCLPVIDSGTADRFGLTDEEIALCCSSHNSEPEHLRVAASMLQKCGVSESILECGAHWPGSEEARNEMVRKGEMPRPIHNNCSGKHAGMIALALQLGVSPEGYSSRTHRVQQAVARAMGEICSVNLAQCDVGIDGCSVPTWAFPLRNMALGFARLGAGSNGAGNRIIRAVRANPFMAAGTGRFDTKIMQAVPRLFIKVGAEGVFCGSIAHAGLGFALKCDDGNSRGAEVAVAAMLARLNVWSAEERDALHAFARSPLKNWMNTLVGEVRAAF